MEQAVHQQQPQGVEGSQGGLSTFLGSFEIFRGELTEAKVRAMLHLD